MLKTDDDIDNMLGLSVFYQHVRTAALNQQCQSQYVSVLTTELVAFYWHIKMSVTMSRQFMKSLSKDEFRQYEILISDNEQLFIGDMLLFVSLMRLLKQKFHRKPFWHRSHQLSINPAEHSASDLLELLQKAAVEHFKTFRQMELRDFGCIATIVTTDFEALYAYRRADYQRCLQLSTQNVLTLLYAKLMSTLSTLPEFIQLLDDDIVSLIALTMIVNPKCNNYSHCVSITQLTLSLYLVTQCQLKLRHSVTSLVQTTDYTAVARRKHPADRIMDQLTMKLTERQIVAYIRTLV